jgi:hypothetical protein
VSSEIEIYAASHPMFATFATEVSGKESAEGERYMSEKPLTHSCGLQNHLHSTD